MNKKYEKKPLKRAYSHFLKKYVCVRIPTLGDRLLLSSFLFFITTFYERLRCAYCIHTIVLIYCLLQLFDSVEFILFSSSTVFHLGQTT